MNIKASADTSVSKKASATANIKSVQIQRLPQRHLHKQITHDIDISDTRKVNPSSLHLFQSRYNAKQEKTMQSSELESGLPDEAPAGVHSLFPACGLS